MHPKNRFERRKIGRKKGYKRAVGMSSGFSWKEINKNDWIQKTSQLLRDTTKRCSCTMCCNPRHLGWHNGLTLQEIKDCEFVENEIEEYSIAA